MKKIIFGLLFLTIGIIPFLKAQSDPVLKAADLIDHQNYKAAKPILQKHLESRESDHNARLLYSQCLIELGEHDEAITHLKTIKKPLEKETDFHFWFGQAYLGKLNASKNFFEKGIIASKVKTAFEKAVELDPENLTARNSLARYYLTAPGIAGGSTKKAKEQLDFIKSRDPKMGYYALGDYYRQKKEYELAKEEYLNFLKITEDKSEVYYLLGYVSQSEKNYEEAFDYFQKATKEKNVYLPAFYQYARTAIFAENNVRKGIQMMESYIEQGGNNGAVPIASAYWRLGMLHELDDKKEKAKKAYQKALVLDPNHKEATKALELLK